MRGLVLILVFVVFGCSGNQERRFLIAENEQSVGIRVASDQALGVLPEPEWTMYVRIEREQEGTWSSLELLHLSEALSELAYASLREPQCMLATRIFLDNQVLEVEFGAWSAHLHGNSDFKYSVYEAGYSILHPLTLANEILKSWYATEYFRWHLEMFEYNYREGGILIYDKTSVDGSDPPADPGRFV